MTSSEFKEAIRYWCLRYAENTADIRGMIGSKFYPAELALITDPKYPCACFDVSDDQLIEKVPKASSGAMRVWSYSKKSLDEASSIQGLLFTALHMTRIQVKDLTIMCWERNRPVDSYDPIEEVHYYMSQWLFKCLEA